jgi:hypothetical protein
LTGSVPIPKTIGIVEVELAQWPVAQREAQQHPADAPAAFAANAAGASPQTITAAPRLTSSLANEGKRLYSPLIPHLPTARSTEEQ